MTAVDVRRSLVQAHGLEDDDWDERLGDLQYRNAFEFAVGHGVATRTVLDAEGRCRTVRTCWIPQAEVEHVAPSPIDNVELRMEALAELADGADAKQKLAKLVNSYRAWNEAQESKVPPTPAPRKQTAEELIRRSRIAADRIEVGINLLQDSQVLQAFRLANRAVATALSAAWLRSEHRAGKS
jgi:hypothetical protein